MKGDRYSDDNPFATFGMLVNALGGGGDRNSTFPQSDAEDFSRGARFVPDEVTMARRAGKTVHFHATCQTSTCCWYWEMPEGERIYHFDRMEHDMLKSKYQGVCPECGNMHIEGGAHK